MPKPLEEHQIIATEKSWLYPFHGKAAEALWQHIKQHFDPNFSSSGMYAHYTSIVQSSGMGKSRVMDQLSTFRFVIPMNLRNTASSGFPPPDHSIRDFLLKAGSPNDATARGLAFLQALFKVTLEHLKKLEEPNVADQSYNHFAATFRKKMTENQVFGRSNPYRRSFYLSVISEADKIICGRMADNTSGFLSPKLLEKKVAEKKDISPYYTAFKDLAEFLASSSTNVYLGMQTLEPMVILSFDEAHVLTKHEKLPDDREWSIFNQLRYTLRGLQSQSLFSVFLSTSGKISQFTSPSEQDLSARVIRGQLTLIQPFTDLGFDHLVTEKIELNDAWNLDRLTSDEYMSSLGRPLFGSRYQAGTGLVKLEIIEFAAAKLLNDVNFAGKVTETQQFACLSQRLPLEFYSTHYNVMESTLVEGHLRICLKIESAFQSMVTTSSSEPLLSEAAYSVMTRPGFNVPQALKTIMEGFAISKGDRGEFLALLLFILARDGIVGPADHLHRPLSGKRFFKLADFLYGHVFQKQNSDSLLVNERSIENLEHLSVDFPDAYLHFNHFVKVHQQNADAIGMEALLLLQGRGAGVLCGNGQESIDAIVTFLNNGQQLVMDKGGLILIQMKNNSSYTVQPEPTKCNPITVFDTMNPYQLGILQPAQRAVPVIKIFFALAAKTSSLKVVRREPSDTYNAVAYEIWCAGLSSEILGPIKGEEKGIWDGLLQASYGWKDLYNASSKEATVLRQSMMPGAANEDGHFSGWSKRREID